MVRIGGDINGIELEPGDTITVNGNEWVYQSDGTLEGPSISTEEAIFGGGIAGSETRMPLIQKGDQAAFYDRGAFDSGGWVQHTIYPDTGSPQLTSPYRIRADADIEAGVRFSTITQDMQLMVGFEAQSGYNDESIILISGAGGDHIEFWTQTGGTITRTDVTSATDWTTEQTIGIEWRNGNRATLYLGGVGGTQVAEHTTNLPSVDALIPFIEAINNTTNNVLPPEQVWAEPRLFDYKQHEL